MGVSEISFEALPRCAIHACHF